MFADLDPRTAATCQQVSLGIAHMALPIGPSMYPLPPLPRRLAKVPEERIAEGPDYDSDFSESDDGKQTPLLATTEDAHTVKCVLSPEDAMPVLFICCFMSLAQGTAMCSFFGAIGYFSSTLHFPALILYTNIAQSLLTPFVLDLQRRYDGNFDVRFGHKTTFLVRIAGLSAVQTVLLLLVPYSSSWFSFLLISSISAAITVMVFAQVCMVISCIEGAQAVNFARTACHAGGVVVVALGMYFRISTQSEPRQVWNFFACAAALQALAVVAWYQVHRHNTSLCAAYAIIATQQSYSAEENKKRAAEAAEAGTAQSQDSGYTWASMFGHRKGTGAALIGSFSLSWFAWSITQPVMNMFGDEDLTQSLVSATYVADTAGRLLSHLLHGCASGMASKVPAAILHGLTLVALFFMVLLMADTQMRFVDRQTVIASLFSLCFAVTFNLNELSVRTMKVAKSRVEVAHCQNYAFFVTTGISKFAALAFQFACGTA